MTDNPNFDELMADLQILQGEWRDKSAAEQDFANGDAGNAHRRAKAASRASGWPCRIEFDRPIKIQKRLKH